MSCRNGCEVEESCIFQALSYFSRKGGVRLRVCRRCRRLVVQRRMLSVRHVANDHTTSEVVEESDGNQQILFNNINDGTTAHAERLTSAFSARGISNQKFRVRAGFNLACKLPKLDCSFPRSSQSDSRQLSSFQLQASQPHSCLPLTDWASSLAPAGRLQAARVQN